jgi:hypothetical protein
METKNPEMQQVMERLARVEKQNRWLVHGGLVLVLSCGIVLLMAQKPVTRTVEAQGFVLKDATGEVRAELHMADSGPELRLYDSQHNTFALIGASKKTGPLLALDAGGRGFVGLSISEKAGPLLSLEMGKANANLTVDRGGPSLHLEGLGGSAWAKVDEGGPSLHLEGSEGSTWARVNELGPYLELEGLGGSMSARANEHEATLSLKDSEGFHTSVGTQALLTSNTGEKTQTSAASIHLFDPKGNALWSAP